MEELHRAGSREHRLVLNNRGILTLTGVVDIISFDLNEILMETDAGMLSVRGQDLHVNRLSVEKGEVDVSGTVDSLQYTELTSYGQKAGNFLQRLFQ